MTIREKCPYSEFFWSVFSRIWTEYGEKLRIFSFSNQMWENTDQSNSKYGHILRCVRHSILVEHLQFCQASLIETFQKQPCRVVLKKRCSKNMQNICRRTTMPKCDFNEVALQLYWNRTLARVFSCKFSAYFQNTFS